jgi:hypothetical protein
MFSTIQPSCKALITLATSETLAPIGIDPFATLFGRFTLEMRVT